MFRTKRIKATVRPTLRITTCLLAVLCVAGSRSSAQDATSHPPTIVSATADFAVQPPQLTITGPYWFVQARREPGWPAAVRSDLHCDEHCGTVVRQPSRRIVPAPGEYRQRPARRVCRYAWHYRT